ncbi:hypothetical protein [Lysobacter sp. TY2-98]|uniref:hypothetical protein n=1 Tax=Lysobacter sp. TY2-98 TaxID=2290922 RepID=UPI0013B3A5FE|nr:hypothetical protein [Lysobacter sp. TY2-98]
MANLQRGGAFVRIDNMRLPHPNRQRLSCSRVPKSHIRRSGRVRAVARCARRSQPDEGSGMHLRYSSSEYCGDDADGRGGGLAEVARLTHVQTLDENANSLETRKRRSCE